MTATCLGMRAWSLQIDEEEGHHDYFSTWRVKTDDPNDGPLSVLDAAGLPAIGSGWSFGNDNNAWAKCTPYAKVTPRIDGEKSVEWWVDLKHSTRPRKRCSTASVQNPLDEPMMLSGSFVKYVKEATQDRFGRAITNSAKQPIKGSAVERDYSRHQVRCSFNVATLPLATFAQMMDCVNDNTLWGLPKRCVKLSQASWERLLYGTCSYYYRITYELDVRFETFDFYYLDRGSMRKIDGGDVDNPDDFKQAKDRQGENIEVNLNGEGEPLKTGEPLVFFKAELYPEANLPALGIPLTF